jgi:hypothetical protein
VQAYLKYKKLNKLNKTAENNSEEAVSVSLTDK